MQLPPMMISLPFKVLLFVMIDGWNLLVGSIVIITALDWVLGHLNEAAFDTELVPPLRVTRA